MLFGLKDETVEKINSVFARFPHVETAVIYGSRAKGNFKNGSDIDLTIDGEGLDLIILNKIKREIDDLLLPYTVDLSIRMHIKNPDLLDHIERVGSVFYKKQNSSID